MKPFQITLVNSFTLIVLGLWGYFGSGNPSFTALIPVVAGILLLSLSGAMKKANKVTAHIVVGLTFILLISLVKPLTAGISRGDSAAVARVVVMMITCLLALAVYVKSFIEARKQRISSR